MDKADWHKIIADDYKLADDQPLEDFTAELLGYLASPDSELRDTIAYSILARWIIKHDYYTDIELINMIEKLMPRMQTSIGSRDDDTVFGRSYAALVLSLIAYHHNTDNFLSDEITRSLLDQARNYLLTERDLRAYVPDKGWANACAHTADLLKFLMRSPVLEADDLKRVMDTVAEKVVIPTEYIFHHDEDERLAQVIMTAINSSMLTTYELDDWLNHFRDWKRSHTQHTVYDASYHGTFQNIKNFLRSLYIHMQLIDSIPVEAADFEPELLNVVGDYSL